MAFPPRPVAGVGLAAAALFVVTAGLVPSGEISPLSTESLIEPRPRPLRDWRLVDDGKGWQLVGSRLPDETPDDGVGVPNGSCPAGTVEVSGDMKIEPFAGAIEELQKEACASWINRNYPERCAAFDPERWKSLSRDLPTRPMHFCIDRFEYPNEQGSYPVVMVTYDEASALCEKRGERLCTEDEWTFACEGEEATPFANGYVRDPRACVLDRPWLPVHEALLAARTGLSVIRELDTLWQGEPSGSNPGCHSVFGVDDTIGNVDEWTRSVQKAGVRSILKGGYWGPVRTQCRVSTRAHGEDFAFYQIGFRCCSDSESPASP
jgi:hypothetical protein